MAFSWFPLLHSAISRSNLPRHFNLFYNQELSAYNPVCFNP
jgi:hypothetical protein